MRLRADAVLTLIEPGTPGELAELAAAARVAAAADRAGPAVRVRDPARGVGGVPRTRSPRAPSPARRGRRPSSARTWSRRRSRRRRRAVAEAVGCGVPVLLAGGEIAGDRDAYLAGMRGRRGGGRGGRRGRAQRLGRRRPGRHGAAAGRGGARAGLRALRPAPLSAGRRLPRRRRARPAAAPHPPGRSRCATSERQVEKSTAWRSAPRTSCRRRPRTGRPTSRTSAASSRNACSGADGVAGEVDELGVAQDVAEHRLGALVVGVELVEGALEALARIADRAPAVEVGPRVGGEVVGRAGREQVGLGREVPVQRAALHAGPLGDRAQRRAGRPDGSVQRRSPPR